MRVVVTGGAGFLGSHLVQSLLERGDEVVSVDNLSSGQLVNVEMFSNNPRFTFIHADVVRGIPVHGHVDVVAHLASPASPPDYHRMPLETLAVGSRGTENALELALRHDARFVLASTSEVYGDPLVHPQVEEYFGNVNSIGRRSVYDEAKRFAEAISMAYRRTCGVNVGIFRIFNTYGPRMRPQDGRVVTSFITQALTGNPITIYGDGSQTRSFCYVDDLIRGIIGMIDSDLSGPINLGNPYERTMLELAELVLELTGSSSGLEFHPLPQDDPTRRRPDITKAQTLLSWEPVVDAEVGLARTIEWFAARPEQLLASVEAVAGPQFEGHDITETREPDLQLSA
jgi:dTDP-glucose 4,6-dehydratase